MFTTPPSVYVPPVPPPSGENTRSTDGGSESPDSDKGSPGSGSARRAALPDPSIISLPLSCSAAVPRYRTTPAGSSGCMSYEKRSTGEPDPDSYRAGLSLPPTPSSRNGLPSTVTASVNLTMASTRSPGPLTTPPWSAPPWWYTAETAGGSPSRSNRVTRP